jgi:hypothetical protein
MNSDTPRTEAARFEALRSSALRQDCVPLKLGQELELELAASKTEVERLKEVIEWSASLMAETGREITAQKILDKATLNPTK